MSVNFVAIDFETANQSRASACSVGMVKVIDGKITDTYYSLINPETPFDPFNIYIHGITEDMVIHEPTYPSVVKDILAFTDGFKLVAHYAPFDMGVIRDSNERYQISNFRRQYFDSYYLSMQYLTTLSYKLNSLARLIGFDFNHHNALEDAAACATLVLYLLSENNKDSIEDLLNGARYKRFGEINGYMRNGFLRTSNRNSPSQSINISEIVSSVDQTIIDEEHIFFQKYACFTGTLQSMKRIDAMKLFAQCGGIPEKGVTQKTNFLVMGDQDLRKVDQSGKSSKIKKAELLLSQGKKIQLLGENEFLQMLDYKNI